MLWNFCHLFLKQVCSLGFSWNWLKRIFQENHVLNYKLFYCYFTIFFVVLLIVLSNLYCVCHQQNLQVLLPLKIKTNGIKILFLIGIYFWIGSDLSPQSCLYFQGFRGSKLLIFSRFLGFQVASCLHSTVSN